MDRNKRIGTLLVMLAITLACAPVLPAVAPLPTQQVGAVDTMIAGTYVAAFTSTAMNTTPTPTPRATLTPSQTPTITATPTATIIFKTPTSFSLPGGGGGGGGGGASATPGGGGGGPIYACRIVKTTPPYGSHQKRGKDFKTTWIVRNTGNMDWDVNSVDYKYFSGAQIQKQSLYDLPFSVAPKKEVALFVAMQVPNKRGTYITTWIMQIGDELFCNLEQKIIAD
jgi:hypothetical protein